MITEDLKLEMVLELANYGKIQEALDKLESITFYLEDEGILDANEVFFGKYGNGGFFMCKGVQLDEDVDLNDSYFYEHKKLENGTIFVKYPTKESIMNTVIEIENILKLS